MLHVAHCRIEYLFQGCLRFHEQEFGRPKQAMDRAKAENLWGWEQNREDSIR
jgi:hypothetical protein